jgi:hypothetical protein
VIRALLVQKVEPVVSCTFFTRKEALNPAIPGPFWELRVWLIDQEQQMRTSVLRQSDGSMQLHHVWICMTDLKYTYKECA